MFRRIAFIVAGLAALSLAAAPAAWPSENLTESLDVKCKTCHDKPGSKLLTSKGKYFELQRTFEGYDEVIRKYRKCTSCHAKAPGSQKLTKRGQRMQDQGLTMEHVSAPKTQTGLTKPADKG